MKKIILLIICCIFLTGCQLDYKLDFKDDKISETITGKFDYDIYEFATDSDSDNFHVEQELVNGELSSLKDDSDSYKKDIQVKDGKTTAILSYDYNYENLKNSYLINECFENSVIYNEDDYYYLHLSGEFYCFRDDDIQVKISSDKKVISENSDEYKDGYYIWNLKMSEDKHEISFQISKQIKVNEVSDNKFNIFPIIGIVIFVICIVVILLFKKKLKNNEE